MKTAVDLLNENEVLREKLKYYIRENERLNIENERINEYYIRENKWLNAELDYYIKYSNTILDKLTEVSLTNPPSIVYVDKNNGLSID